MKEGRGSIDQTKNMLYSTDCVRAFFIFCFIRTAAVLTLQCLDVKVWRRENILFKGLHEHYWGGEGRLDLMLYLMQTFVNVKFSLTLTFTFNLNM